jgi:thymidylate synthase ThyX
MIKVNMVADSISPWGKRICTFSARVPRVILAELNTHRLLSRNAESARARKTSRLLAQLEQEGVYEPMWTQDAPGMGDAGVLDADSFRKADSIYREYMRSATLTCHQLSELGIHKQDANRVIEPLVYVKWLVTSTEWDNFFALRTQSSFFPESRVYPPFRKLARAMYVLMHRMSKPSLVLEGEWHLPYVTAAEAEYSIQDQLVTSAARCARVTTRSLSSGDLSTMDEDHATFNRIVASLPPHASVVEHQASPLNPNDHEKTRLQGNFRGWIQYRKMIQGEQTLEFKPSDMEVDDWADQVYPGTFDPID